VPTGATITVGRRKVDLCILDPMVSRNHCLLSAREDGDEVTDLVSMNGTRVNGNRVENAVLAPGDVVRVGDTEIEYISQAPAGPPARSLTGHVPAEGVPTGNSITAAYRPSDIKKAIENKETSESPKLESADGAEPSG
jgi:hypothetical protein